MYITIKNYKKVSLIENVYVKDTFNVNLIFLSYIFNIKIVEVKETNFNMIKNIVDLKILFMLDFKKLILNSSWFYHKSTYNLCLNDHALMLERYT